MTSILVLTACGGGGAGSDGGATNGSDGTGDSGGSGNVSITPPDQDLKGHREDFTRTSSGIYETERSSTIFNGGVSFVDSAECNGHTGIDVTVTNAATGETVNASERVTCDLIIRVGQWQSGSVALNFGENRITARAETGATASITIVRVANPPTVTSVFPVNNSIDVAVNGTVVRADFSENLSSSSVDSTSFIVEDQTGTTVPGIVRYTFEGQINIPSHATFTPNESLQFGTTYTVRLTTAITDSHGNSLADEFTWSFTTVPDLTPPTKVAESPVAGDVCVAPDRAISVLFDKLLNPDTVTAATFMLEDSTGTPVDGEVVLNDLIATFTPATPLNSAMTYTAHLNAGITDLGGNPLPPSSWSFTTPYLAEGSWTSIAVPANLAGRTDNSVVWTGAEMIVWGGRGQQLFDDGARYNPALDQWSDISSIGAPSAREEHSATWTGTEMIVWGGIGQTFFLRDGARYDPATDSWTPMSTNAAPSERNGHTAIWTGTELIVWGGGWGEIGLNSDGRRYDPSTDTWTVMSSVNAPAVRTGHHAVFDGQRMIVWGGVSTNGSANFPVSNGGVYDPVSDVWTPLPTQNAPDITKSTSIPDSVVQAGTDMMVWSPWSDVIRDPVTNEFASVIVSEARRYDSVQEQWQTVVDACESIATPNAVWLNGRMLSWNEDFTEGYAYDAQRDGWHPVTSFPGAPTTDAKVIAIGDSVIVWGGRADSVGFTNVGYRLEP